MLKTFQEIEHLPESGTLFISQTDVGPSASSIIDCPDLVNKMPQIREFHGKSDHQKNPLFRGLTFLLLLRQIALNLPDLLHQILDLQRQRAGLLPQYAHRLPATAGPYTPWAS